MEYFISLEHYQDIKMDEMFNKVWKDLGSSYQAMLYCNFYRQLIYQIAKEEWYSYYRTKIGGTDEQGRD